MLVPEEEPGAPSAGGPGGTMAYLIEYADSGTVAGPHTRQSRRAGIPVAARASGRGRGGRPARAALLLTALASLIACSNAAPNDPPAPTEWRSYGGSLARTFFNPAETAVTRDTAARLVPLWRFTTGGIVTAQPMVARVDLPGAPATEMVFISSWDGHHYALRAADGSLVWSFAFKPHPGASYPAVSSAAIEDIDGRRVVIVSGGMTMYALDAATGAEIWAFDAGTGCTTCDSAVERNEIESSPAVFEGVVSFGMDVNDGRGKGGFLAVDARRGTLRWFFDLASGTVCHADPDDEIRRFDGYHSAAELGLPPNFFATRRGCNFDRTPNSCGNIWSSASIDPKRRLLYTASSNCDTDNRPTTPEPPPPMPPWDEAIFALRLDSGEPVWRWRAREVDNDDLGYGGVPNLFAIEVDGVWREVVGVGNKDGRYVVLDRDGVNERSGVVEPYWITQTVPGGSIGGILQSAAVGEGRVMFTSGFGLELNDPQKPAAVALDAATGKILWALDDAPPSYSPTSAVPGVVFMGSTYGSLFAYDSTTGQTLNRLPAGGPLGSPATIVGGRVYIGAGTGERGGNPTRIAYQVSLIPSPVSAFCLAGTAGCPEGGSCDDGNACTADSRVADACVNQPRPDGTTCELGEFDGHCSAGTCLLDAAVCPSVSECTHPVAGADSCRYEPVPDGKECHLGAQGGTCLEGNCIPVG